MNSEISLLKTLRQEDLRGIFEKLLPVSRPLSVNEIFYSVSGKGVIRGMHYQDKPFASTKVIKVIQGKVVDVLLNINERSEDYGIYQSFELDPSSEMLYIPPGYAHGFQALAEDTIMLYLVDELYNKEYDRGFKFDSFGFDWPIENYTISERDNSLPIFK